MCPFWPLAQLVFFLLTPQQPLSLCAPPPCPPKHFHVHKEPQQQSCFRVCLTKRNCIFLFTQCKGGAEETMSAIESKELQPLTAKISRDNAAYLCPSCFWKGVETQLLYGEHDSKNDFLSSWISQGCQTESKVLGREIHPKWATLHAVMMSMNPTKGGKPKIAKKGIFALLPGSPSLCFHLCCTREASNRSLLTPTTIGWAERTFPLPFCLCLFNLETLPPEFWFRRNLKMNSRIAAFHFA